MNPNSIEYIAELRELLSAAHEFEKNSVKWPTLDNRLEFFANSGAGELSIVDSAKSARILVHPKVRTLATNFLECKRKHGSKKEKQLYCEMSTDTFLRRLIVQRPLVFMTEDDITLLRDGTPGVSQDWNVVGLDNERTIKITDYLTYDEMAVAALLGVSAEVHFINSGSRYNAGIRDLSAQYERTGVLSGLVGARFERRDKMESLHTLVSPEQNKMVDSNLQQIWAEFYGLSSFPQYKQALTMPDSLMFKARGLLFNIEVFKMRIMVSSEIFLMDAQDRAAQQNRKAYLNVVGLGLGVWAVLPEQETWFLEAFSQAVSKLPLPNISNIHFAWFKNDSSILQKSEFIYDSNNLPIHIHFSKEDPNSKLMGKDEGKLRVSMFAWDGNSMVGNEYWMGNLSSSGDPAAAASSTIPEILNPFVNCHLTENLFPM